MWRKSVIAALAAPALALGGAAAAQDGPPALEVLANLPAAPGNITVTPDGLVVVSVHPFFQTPGDIAMAVTPEGEFSWFPGEGAGELNRVLSVRSDLEGDVWMLAGMGGGASRIYIVDGETRALERTIEIDAPGASLNDMALAPEHGVVVMSDPGGAGAVSVLDTETGELRRLLVGHASVSAEDVDAPIDGIPLAQRPGSPMRSGINPITIDSGEEWAYYGAMTGESLYRVRLADLLDESLSAEDLAARVERHGDKAPSAGITIDEAGNVYVCDVGARAIGVTTPDGEYRVLVQDDELLDWADGLSVGPDGYVYVAANGLYRNFASHADYDAPSAPFPLVRFKALAETAVGR